MKAAAPTITIKNVEKVAKRQGGYVPPQKRITLADGTTQYVPDWSRRGYYQRDERRYKTRAYVWFDGETVLDNFVGRFSRPVPLMRLALKQALADLGIDAVKATWNQRAGCSCGCSPAFVLDEALGFDLHISFTADQPAIDPAKADVAAARAQAIAKDPTMPDGFRAEALRRSLAKGSALTTALR